LVLVAVGSGVAAPAQSDLSRVSTIDDVILPEKTEIFLTLKYTVSTKTAQSGDKIFGQIAVPVTVNDRVLLPVGSHVIAHVQEVKRPGYLKGKSELLLAFDSVILPDGTTRQIKAVIQSAEGYETDSADEEGTLRGAAGQGSATVSSAAKGAAIGGVVGAAADRSLKGAGIGGAIGAGAGALAGLFKKGDQVILKKGTVVNIQLRSDIRFVRPAPRNPFKKLGSPS